MKFLISIFCLTSISLWAVTPVRQLFSENRLDEAATLCRQFEGLGTNDNDNFFACAWIYYRSDRDDAAKKILERLRKSYALPEYQLLLGYGLMKNKQYEEARRYFISVQTENKGTAVGLTATELNAETYEAQGNLDTAAFIYKQVVGEDSTRTRSHWGLGRYYLARGDTFRAKTHLEITAKKWPKHIGSRYNLGTLALAQDNVPDAAKWLVECFRLNKADAGVLEQLGVVFEKKNLIPEAVRYWQRAIEINKDTVLAKEKLSTYLVQMVDTLVEGRKYEEALAKIESSGRNVGEDSKLLLRRALIYKALNKFDKAAADLNAYLRSNDNDSSAHRALGICYVNQKAPRLAMEQFERAIALEPNNGMNYGWYAFILEGKGELARAKESWQKALQYLKEPAEVEKANRRLSSIEKKLGQKE